MAADDAEREGIVAMLKDHEGLDEEQGEQGSGLVSRSLLAPVLVRVLSMLGGREQCSLAVAWSRAHRVLSGPAGGAIRQGTM